MVMHCVFMYVCMYVLCIYGDPAYPLGPQLQTAFRGARVTPLERQWNQAMNEVRTSVEWVFWRHR